MKKGIAVGMVLSTGIAFAQAPNTAMTMEQQIENLNQRIIKLEKWAQRERAKTLADLPLDKPGFSAPEIIDWAAQSVQSIYQYDYDNFSKVLLNVRPYFTSTGYESYVKALEASKNLQTIQDKKLAVSVDIEGPGKILTEGAEQGVYVWHVNVPIKVVYKGKDQLLEQKLNMKMEVARVKATEAPYGIAINSMTGEVVQK